MNATALACTVLLGLLLFGLGFGISILRFNSNRLAGHSGDPDDLLHKVVRAHGNTSEYAPFLAVLFLYIGMHGPSPTEIGLIVAATVSRFLTVIGLTAWPTMAKPNPLRFLGAIGTYLAGAALCVTAWIGG